MSPVAPGVPVGFLATMEQAVKAMNEATETIRALQETIEAKDAEIASLKSLLHISGGKPSIPAPEVGCNVCASYGRFCCKLHGQGQGRA